MERRATAHSAKGSDAMRPSTKERAASRTHTTTGAGRSSDRTDEPDGHGAGFLLSEPERTRLGVRGHSIHGSRADVSRMISEFPPLPFALPDDLARGFTRTESRMLGHWLRDKPG